MVCFILVHDANAAFKLYTSAVSKRPELKSIESLHALMGAVRGCISLNNDVLELYFEALQDEDNFPELLTDVKTMVNALKIFDFVQSRDPAYLKKALALRDQLIAKGVQPSSTLYEQLIKTCGIFNDYAQSKALYAASVAEGVPLSIGVETALLRQAYFANNLEDALEIYQRIITTADLPMTGSVVYTMLQIANRAGQQEMAVGIAVDWLARDGALTWAMCSELLTAALDTKVMRSLSGSARPTTALVKKAVPSQQQKGEPRDREEEKAFQQLQKQKGLLVKTVLDLVKAHLPSLTGRALRYASTQLLPDYNPRDTSDAKTSVPIDVLSRLAALLVEDIDLELVLNRIELTPYMFEDRVKQRVAHVEVVHCLARDLALLGRWRELVALCARVDTYREAHDLFQYSPAERAVLDTYCAVALLRVGGQAERATHHLSVHLSSRFERSAVDQVVSAVFEALTAVSTHGFSAELSHLLAHVLPQVDVAAARSLVTASLASCSQLQDVAQILRGDYPEMTAISSPSPGGSSSSAAAAVIDEIDAEVVNAPPSYWLTYAQRRQIETHLSAAAAAASTKEVDVQLVDQVKQYLLVATGLIVDL